MFKDYYPEIIVGEAVRGKASAFKVGFFLDGQGDVRACADEHSIPMSCGAPGWLRFKTPTVNALRNRDRRGLRADSGLIDLLIGPRGTRPCLLC